MDRRRFVQTSLAAAVGAFGSSLPFKQSLAAILSPSMAVDTDIDAVTGDGAKVTLARAAVQDPVHRCEVVAAREVGRGRPGRRQGPHDARRRPPHPARTDRRLQLGDARGEVLAHLGRRPYSVGRAIGDVVAGSASVEPTIMNV